MSARRTVTDGGGPLAGARLAVCLSLVAAALTLGACGGGGDPGAVKIVDFGYEPDDVSVEAGTPIEFTNEDAAAHTATATDSSFDTGTLDKGDAKEITIDEPGTYDYYCRFHAFMKATVTVK